MRTIFVAVALVVATSSGQKSTGPSWPQVSALDATFVVTDRNPHVQTTVFDKQGRRLYQVVCHEGDFEDIETGPYDLLFQCKLVPANRADHVRDLFVPSLDWGRTRTRARFNYAALKGACSDHPYYGRIRTFAIRGMHIEMEVRNYVETPSIEQTLMLKLVKPTSYSFTLRLAVTPDPNARNAIAGPVPEVCEAVYELDRNGRVHETKRVYRDPAIK